MWRNKQCYCPWTRIWIIHSFEIICKKSNNSIQHLKPTLYQHRLRYHFPWNQLLLMRFFLNNCSVVDVGLRWHLGFFLRNCTSQYRLTVWWYSWYISSALSTWALSAFISRAFLLTFATTYYSRGMQHVDIPRDSFCTRKVTVNTYGGASFKYRFRW